MILFEQTRGGVLVTRSLCGAASRNYTSLDDPEELKGPRPLQTVGSPFLREISFVADISGRRREILGSHRHAEGSAQTLCNLTLAETPTLLYSHEATMRAEGYPTSCSR